MELNYVTGDCMRILLVRRGSIENPDGISTYILSLAQELSRRGHDVRIMSGYLSSSYRPPEGFEVIPGPNSPSPIAWTKELRRVTTEYRPDIIHVNNAIPILLRGIPMVMTHHGTVPLHMDIRIKRLQSVYRMYLTISFLNYKRVIVPSSKLKEELSKLLLLPQALSKLVVIPIGVDLRVCGKYGRRLPERELAVVHAGTRVQKNLRCTINALRLIWRKGIKATLYITGPETPYLRHCMSDLNAWEREHVKYMGLLNKEQYYELLGKARVYILPSYYEAFSIATLESLCCGTPAVVSNAIPDELVIHGVNGFKIEDPNDFKAFAQYVKTLLLDDDLWEKMSRACLRISKLYDVNVMVDRILVLYNSCISTLR